MQGTDLSNKFGFIRNPLGWAFMGIAEILMFLAMIPMMIGYRLMTKRGAWVYSGIGTRTRYPLFAIVGNILSDLGR
jgi:hypothetical protein